MMEKLPFSDLSFNHSDVTASPTFPRPAVVCRCADSPSEFSVDAVLWVKLMLGRSNII